MAGTSYVERLASGTLEKVGGLVKSQMNIPGVVGGLMGYGMYKDMREKGHGVIGSAVGAVGQDMFWKAMGGAGLALGAVQIAGSLVPAGYQGYKTAAQSLARSNRAFSNGYVDTQAAYTMRQRALQEIQSSRLNARSALGNEAQYMHR